MQKIVRNAKKMPEKTLAFYKVSFFFNFKIIFYVTFKKILKELNRIRRAALSFGFYELLEGIAVMLERETNTSNNPESVLQLNHTIRALRSQEYKEYKNDILPHTIKRK
jgi:hypothetical protein